MFMDQYNYSYSENYLKTKVEQDKRIPYRLVFWDRGFLATYVRSIIFLKAGHAALTHHAVKAKVPIN